MSVDISIVEKTEQFALSIKDTVSTMKLGKVMGPAYEAIFAYLTENNIECSEGNIPFCIYHQVDWQACNNTGFIAMFKMMFMQKWHLEMGIPSDTKLADKDSIKGMNLPQGRFLRAIHKGPYMKVAETYKLILAEAQSQGLALDSFSIEYYLNDPREVSAQDLQTEVLVPIKA